MSDPGDDHRERTIAPLVMGAVFVAVILAGVFWQRERLSQPQPPAPPPVTNQAVPPTTPEPPAVLDRDGLVRLYDQARGAGDAAAISDLVGRSFAVTLPFVCEGSQPSASLRTEMAFSGERRSLTLIARPTEWTTLPVIQTLPEAARPEYVEGFWISRPWIAGDGCPDGPAPSPPALPTPPAAETIGIALVSGNSDPRTARHSVRPYQITQALDGGAVDLSTYRLRLEGRIAAYPDGAPAKCWAESPDHRPVCIFAVNFERVSILNGESTLATWAR